MTARIGRELYRIAAVRPNNDFTFRQTRSGAILEDRASDETVAVLLAAELVAPSQLTRVRTPCR